MANRLRPGIIATPATEMESSCGSCMETAAESLGVRRLGLAASSRTLWRRTSLEEELNFQLDRGLLISRIHKMSMFTFRDAVEIQLLQSILKYISSDTCHMATLQPSKPLAQMS